MIKLVVGARRQKAFSLATKLIDAVPLLRRTQFKTSVISIQPQSILHTIARVAALLDWFERLCLFQAGFCFLSTS